MKKEDGEFLIKRLESGNEYDLYRPSSDLSIVLRLMLHNHMKLAHICDMTVCDIYQWHIDAADGKLPIKKDKRGIEILISKLSKEDYAVVKEHIKKKNLSPNDKLITVTKRALRYKYKNLVNVNYSEENAPEMGQFYFAGLGIEDCKSMKRN